MNLKSKKVLLAAWGCENPNDTHMYQIWYLTLKKIFPNLKTFDTKKIYFQSGKQEMNRQFLKKVQEEKPEVILFTFDNDEFLISTLEKLFEIAPKTKKIALICDDDSRFENHSIFMSLFLDGIIQSPNMEKEYKKLEIKNAFFHFDYNTNKLKPLNIEKKFDITFIGRPKSSRYEVVKFLKDNGIKVGLFGWGWHEYPELKEIYQGPLNQEDYNRVINQSKIKLTLTGAGFSEEKNHFNMKGGLFETALCGTFQLIEHYPGIKEFYTPKKEIGTFKSKQELLEKIKYYLKHEKLRENLAKKAYQKTITKFNRENHLRKIFSKILKQKQTKNKLPELNKKVTTLTKNDFNLSKKELILKLKNINYITFSQGINQKSPLKDYMHVYSIKKLKKPISCCDYYVDSVLLGDYLLFNSKFAFKRIKKKANHLININQLMTTKEFFFKNLKKFKKILNNQESTLINEENTSFISIPLLRIKNFNKTDYESTKKSFEMKFINNLFTKIHKNNFLIIYPINLFLKSITHPFILFYLFESLKNQSNWDKLKANKIYIKDSFFGKYSGDL